MYIKWKKCSSAWILPTTTLPTSILKHFELRPQRKPASFLYAKGMLHKAFCSSTSSCYNYCSAMGQMGQFTTTQMTSAHGQKRSSGQFSKPLLCHQLLSDFHGRFKTVPRNRILERCSQYNHSEQSIFRVSFLKSTATKNNFQEWLVL